MRSLFYDFSRLWFEDILLEPAFPAACWLEKLVYL